MANDSTYKVALGGKLVTRASSENVGRLNYVEKTNWRRIDDAEAVREGTELYRGNSGLPQGVQALNAGSDILALWEAIRPNGERVLVAATRTTVYKYVYSTGTWATVGTGFSTDATFWEAEQMDGYLIMNNGVNILHTLRAEDSATYPIYEMREAGIASVRTIAIYNGFLMCGDVTEIASTEMAAWMLGATPYGVPPDNICNRIRYKIVWSDFGKPRNWAPIIGGTIDGATKNKIILDYASAPLLEVGAKLAIIGAGVGGGTLGGQTGFDEGVTVTEVNLGTREITINTNANTSLTYPLSVTVTRFVDVSTFVGSSSIQDDSSAIVKLKPLRNALAVYRETGIFTGRYTGVVELPFAFRPEYQGRNVPYYPRAVVDLDGESHLYPTENSFYEFDGAGEPRLFAPLDDASSLFFNGLTLATSAKAFAARNPVTRELWFNSVNGVLAYDYVTKTASWIDESYQAFTYARKPDGTASTLPSEFWFLMARGGNVLKYGLNDSGVALYSRLGLPYTATIKWGLNDLRTEYREKDLLSYTPLLASGSAQSSVEVALYSCEHPSAPPVLLEGFPLTIQDPTVNSQVDTFFRGVYFQDRIRVQVTPMNPIKISGRIFVTDTLKTDGATRR